MRVIKGTRTRGFFKKPPSEYNLFDADMNFINAKLCLAFNMFMTRHIADIMHHFSFMLMVACGLLPQNRKHVHVFVHTLLYLLTLSNTVACCYFVLLHLITAFCL